MWQQSMAKRVNPIRMVICLRSSNWDNLAHGQTGTLDGRRRGRDSECYYLFIVYLTIWMSAEYASRLKDAEVLAPCATQQ